MKVVFYQTMLMNIVQSLLLRKVLSGLMNILKIRELKIGLGFRILVVKVYIEQIDLYATS